MRPPHLDPGLAERKAPSVDALGPVAHDEQTVGTVWPGAVHERLDKLEAHEGEVLCLVDDCGAVGRRRTTAGMVAGAEYNVGEVLDPSRSEPGVPGFPKCPHPPAQLG